MKDGVITNTSRGGIIDEEALLEYINAKLKLRVLTYLLMNLSQISKY